MTQLHRAVVRAYTAGTHKADVQLATSVPALITGVPVATDIPAADVVAGRECAVLFFTDDNPDDAVVITIHGALPSGGGVSDHGALTGLLDDDHTQHPLLAGRAGGQDQAGGNAANEVLTLRGTSHATVATARIDLVNSHLRFATIGKEIQDSAGSQRLLVATTGVTTIGRLYVNCGTLATGTGFGAGIAPVVHAYGVFGNAGAGQDDKYGILVDMGATTSSPGNTVVGIAGRALARDAASTTAYGLDYLAGALKAIVGVVYGCRTQAYIQPGAGNTIDTYVGYTARGGIKINGTLSNWVGFGIESIGSIATNRIPFSDTGSTAVAGDNHGNRFRWNTQFASNVGAFGTGDGVIGIANATTVPSTNPAGGGVLYAEAGALKWRGSAGTVTTIAAA